MNTDRQHTLAELRRKIRTHEHHFPQDLEAISTGSPVLNRLFPGAGLRRGSLVEWIGLGEASGAGTLSLLVARQLFEKHRPAVVVDSAKEIYPLALLPAGSDPASLILVRPNSAGESLWAIEQALCCEAVSIVWGVVPQLSPVAYRRLKLAAERSGSVGFLLRSAPALRQSSWADVRLAVEPRPAWGESPSFCVRTLYSRGEATQSSVNVQIDGTSGLICGVKNTDEQTPVVSLVS